MTHMTPFLTIALLVLFGCQKPTSDTTTTNKNAEMSKAILNAETPKPPDPAAKPPPPKTPQMFAGSHILITHKEASRAKPDVKRTKEEALKLAKKLATEAKKNPGGFAELAKKHSSCPSSAKGGSLGSWPKGRMVPAFDQAIEKLAVGQVSDPVETPFGYHVIMRQDPEAAR